MNIAYKEDKELQPFLYNACLTVLRFKKFSTSRWLIVGSSMRTLLAGCALGLWGFHTATLADPSVSSYHIGGFSRLDVAMLRDAVIAGISSRPSEALALDLLEDDRAMRSIDMYEASVLKREIARS